MHFLDAIMILLSLQWAILEHCMEWPFFVREHAEIESEKKFLKKEGGIYAFVCT